MVEKCGSAEDGEDEKIIFVEIESSLWRYVIMSSFFQLRICLRSAFSLYNICCPQNWTEVLLKYAYIKNYGRLIYLLKYSIDNMAYTPYYKGGYMANFEAVFYEKKNGEIPVQDFLGSLNVKMLVKLSGLIVILQEYGNQLREPYSKHLDDGIFELRVKVGSDIARVLYFFFQDGKIILTNGFIKKTQKTPRGEIERAKDYRKDYLERCVKDEEI